MENIYWHKQTLDKPLFEDVLWNRPENRRHAGKLLIIGGNTHAIAAPGLAYSAAEKAAIGTARVLLPDVTKKIIGKIFPEAEFAPSTPSGSFSRQSLAQLLESADWADGVLLAGDFGKNSETAILLESFADKYKGLLCVAQDGVDYFLQSNSPLLSRADTLIATSLGQLQKLAKNNRPSTPILHNMNLHELASVLADWTNGTQAEFITNHAEQTIVANDGQVSTTPVLKEGNWEVELPAFATTWWLQQPSKSFEALTTAIFEYYNTKK